MDDCLQNTEKHDTAEVIRDVCQHTEPERIWDALEAKGIETTPGMIYQALNHTGDPKAPVEGSGLAAEDLATLGTLAVKAGGVEPLIRILSVCQQVAK